jgi:hypothetical protein
LIPREDQKAFEEDVIEDVEEIDPKSDTIAWGEEIDLDPYVLREKIEKSKKS